MLFIEKRIPPLLTKGDRPYVEIEGTVEPVGIMKRYLAGIRTICNSSATSVELTLQGMVYDEEPYDDYSSFFQVYLSTGVAHDSPWGDGKRNRNGGA
jgi:hypothetical protein